MKFTPSLAGAMSGSMGGTTASHNRGGQYFRRRAVPVSPNTPRQQATKAAFGALVQSWIQDLSTAQRAAWTAYAAGTPRTDTLGQTLILTGQQAYIAANAPRIPAGVVTAQDAPTVLDTGAPVTSITEFARNIAGDGIVVTVNFEVPTSDAGNVLLYIGAKQNPTRRFFKGPYQLAALTPVGADVLTAQITTLDVDWRSDTLPLAPDIGSIYPLRVVVAYNDGRTSQQFATLAELTQEVP